MVRLLPSMLVMYIRKKSKYTIEFNKKLFCPSKPKQSSCNLFWGAHLANNRVFFMKSKSIEQVGEVRGVIMPSLKVYKW